MLCIFSKIISSLRYVSIWFLFIYCRYRYIPEKLVTLQSHEVLLLVFSSTFSTPKNVDMDENFILHHISSFCMASWFRQNKQTWFHLHLRKSLYCTNVMQNYIRLEIFNIDPSIKYHWNIGSSGYTCPVEWYFCDKQVFL